MGCIFFLLIWFIVGYYLFEFLPNINNITIEEIKGKKKIKKKI